MVERLGTGPKQAALVRVRALPLAQTGELLVATHLSFASGSQSAVAGEVFLGTGRAGALTACWVSANHARPRPDSRFPKQAAVTLDEYYSVDCVIHAIIMMFGLA